MTSQRLLRPSPPALPDLAKHDEQLSRVTETPDTSDNALMERVAEHDERALEHLYNRYGSIVLRRAARIVGTTDLAEDIVQDTFITLWRDASRFDPTRGSLMSWLLTIVHHRSVDRLRRTRFNLPLHSSDSLWEGGSDDPEEQVIAEMRVDAVRSALQRLPLEQRRAIELSFLVGHTHRQIAEMTGCPIGTIKGRVRLGLEKLRATDTLAPYSPT